MTISRRRFAAMASVGVGAISLGSLSPNVANAVTAEQQAQLDAALAALEAIWPGHLMNNPLADQWNVYGTRGAYRARGSAAEGIPGGQCQRVIVSRAQPNPWDVGISIPIGKGVGQGDNVLLAFWARSTAPATGGSIQASVGLRAAPYTSYVQRTITLTNEWKIYYVRGTANETQADGSLRVGFNVGNLAQTVEIGQVYVENFGTRYRLDQLPDGSE